MEKNYKLKIRRSYEEKAAVDEYFEKLGQAIIRVKTFGAEQRAANKCPYLVDWKITNWTDNEDNNNLLIVGGDYTAAWEPIIRGLKTFE